MVAGDAANCNCRRHDGDDNGSKQDELTFRGRRENSNVETGSEDDKESKGIHKPKKTKIASVGDIEIDEVGERVCDENGSKIGEGGK